MSKIPGNGVRAPQWGPGRFGWSQHHVDGVDVVRLAGVLDLATGAELRDRLMSVVESSDAATIVLDLSEVRFIDAHSIGVIVAAWSAATGRGRQFRVDGARGVPALLFDLLGLAPILIGPTEASAGGRGAGDRGRRAGGGAPRHFTGGAHAAG